MPTLIRSKLQVPTPSGLLHRSRLCQTLKRGLDRKLTIISAPAGYGKTSALVDFARHIPVPVCWYTVDERDRDLNLFIRYIIGAIMEQFPGFGEKARAVVADRDGELFREPTAVVADLVNEILDLQTDFVLVFDNFEPVEGVLGIREFVRRMIEVLPANCHLMLGSRVLPDVPVTQLVAKQELVGLTEEDLRFTPNEIRELLERSYLQVSDSQAAVIASSAEGWITGVLLLADLLREDAATTVLDADRATARTYGYLATEVLERQPPDVRRFLYASSCLREMSARLCREALDVSGPHFLLGEIERRNLFVTRFGEGGGAAYRYHKLFRDFLQAQLRGQKPVVYESFHRRAGAWFEQEHNVEEAVYHYVAAEAYPEATELMERVAMEWFTRGRVETLLGWAEAIPEDVRSEAPRLALYQSKILTDRYEYQDARRALVYAESGFAQADSIVQLAKVHGQRAVLALFQDRYEDVILEASLALEMLGGQDPAERAAAQRMIGRAYVGQGRPAEGISELHDALALFQEVGSPYDVLNLLQDLTFAFASQGRLDDSADCLNEALPLARRLGSSTQLAGVLNNLGMLHYERSDYGKALALHEEGLSVARGAGDARSQSYLAEGMATIYRDAGAYQRAERLYEMAWQIAKESSPQQAADILGARADMFRWRGDLARALRLLGQARQLSEEKALGVGVGGMLAVREGITLAESGEIGSGLRLLDEGLSSLEQQGTRRDLAKGVFLRAKTRLLANERRPAAEDLRRAMSLAGEIGTIQFAVAESRHAEDLLEFGLGRGVPGCRQLAEGVERLRSFGREIEHDRVGPKERSGSRLEIYALGEGRVVRDGNPVAGSAWQAAMAKELFFYILLQGPIERDAVGVVFWPDLPAGKVTSNFHSTLYRVRRAVGSEVVVVRDGQYQLGDVDYWFDVAEFESLVERAQLLPPQDWQAEELWRRAVKLYQGDFLIDVDRPWCVPRRESLRSKYVQCLIGVGRCYQARGAFEDAVTWFRRALETDTLREDVHRRIMRCYAEAGRRSQVLGQYEECRGVLKHELGVGPSPETVSLYKELTGQRAARQS